MRAVDVSAMAEQSHRKEMSAAIRAQRERHAVPKTIAPEPTPPPAPTPAEPERRKGFFSRFRGS